MEPITTVAIKIAENVYEVANEIKEISKDVYKTGESVLKIKKISESEGKEQIEAIGDFIKNDVGNLPRDVFIDELPKSGLSESVLPRDVFIDELPKSGLSESVLPSDVFIDELPKSGLSESILPNDVFIDEIPKSGLSESVLLSDVFIDEFPKSGLSESILPNDVFIDEVPGNDSLDELQKEDELNLVEKEESVIENKHEGLTEQEKQEIKERTGWSDKIVDHIRTKEEAEIPNLFSFSKINEDYSLGMPKSIEDGGKGRWTGRRGDSIYIFDKDQRPKTANYGNMKNQTFGELGRDLGDPSPQVRFRKGYPVFDRDPATTSQKPLEVSFPEGIGQYLKKKSNGIIDRQYLHDAAFEKIANKYGMSIDELKVFKGDSSPVSDLVERWNCSEEEVWCRCNNPHKIQRVLHEVEDGKRVQLVPRIYHDNVTHSGGVDKVAKYIE